MLPPLIDRTRRTPADKWLWALLGALAIGQLVAFWMLCTDQVQKAEVRQAAFRAERIAMRDDCAPRDGRATCMPQAQRSARELNDVMAAMR